MKEKGNKGSRSTLEFESQTLESGKGWVGSDKKNRKSWFVPLFCLFWKVVSYRKCYIKRWYMFMTNIPKNNCLDNIPIYENKLSY